MFKNSISKNISSSISLIAILFSINNITADEGLIPLEHFACYSNGNSFSISPDGKYMLITNTMKAA